MHSWKHVISTNAIFHWILSFSIFFSFFTLNLYQSFHLFTNQCFIKSTTRFSKRSYFFCFISPCQYIMLPGMQEWVVSMLENLYSNIQGSDRIFDLFFPESNPELWVSALISMAIYLYAIIQKDEGQCN